MKRFIYLLVVLFALSVNAQNVGIGLTAPTAKVQINSTSSDSRPVLLLSDSTSGTNNFIQFSKQGVTSNWLLSALPHVSPGLANMKFSMGGGSTPLTLLGDGRVGINNPNPLLALDVNSASSNPAQFNGSNQMFITLAEQGIYRGYMGSYSGAVEDVDFGTYSSNGTGKVHLTTGNQPRLSVIPNGNVGINTVIPTEKLQVNGSVNITETIKANGTAGQPGQVLSTNNSGGLQWTDPVEFKNHITITDVGPSGWTVPTGVSRVFVEGWGAGGGGSVLGGGGGGAYIAVELTVTPGQLVEFSVGTGGNGGSGSGANGGNTDITTPSGILTAMGGRGSIITAGLTGGIGRGGYLNNFIDGNYRYLPGEDGAPATVQYFQSGTSVFLEETRGGKGGDAANAPHTGSFGGYRLFNTSTATVVRSVATHSAVRPGGGGGNDAQGGTFGAAGLIIIHY